MLTAALAACGPVSPRAEQANVEAFGSGSRSSASRVEVREVSGHPRLAVVKREGDPSGAVAVIANVAGPREALSLALVFEARLADAGFSARKSVRSTSFSLGVYTSDPSAVIGALRGALAKPIAEADVARLEQRLSAVHTPEGEAFLAATSECEGELALPRAWKHLSSGELEKARRDAFGAAALVMGAVGDAHFVDAATKALAASEAFPQGAAPPPPAWPAERATTAGRLENVTDGGSEIRVALALPDPRAAVSIARSFDGEEGAALRAKLARLSVPFTLERVSGVAHEKGGCLAVRLRARAAAPDDALVSATLLAESIAERDLAKAAESAADPDVALESVLGASDPLEAAELAAWWSESASVSGATPVARVAVALSSKAPDGVVTRVGAGLAKPASSQAEPVDLVARSELGQGEIWVVLANPCAASVESKHLWGASSEAVLARTLDASRDGVAIEPLISPEAVGVVAHASARTGEASDDLARRVAGRAAEALLGGPPTTDQLLRAAGHARKELEREWGNEALGLDAFAGAMAPDHPSAFEPLGSLAGLTRSDVARGVAAWEVVARGPLRLAVLANESTTQGPAALAATSRWMLPGPAARCPNDAAPEPHPGHDDVRQEPEKARSHQPLEEVSLSRALIGVPLGKGSDARELGDVLRALMDGPAKLATSIHGSPPAVVISVEAPDEHLADAEKAATDVLFRIGRGEVPDDAVNRALAAALASAEQRWSDPRERALALIDGRSPTASFGPAHIDGARFRAWAKTALTESRLTIVDAHR